ncbi:MAG: YdeI family protein [Thermoanaerobaculia bacterium]
MNRTDPRIDAYIGKSADFARPILRHLRELVHEACPEAEETIKWGMPSFVFGGKILCGMAAFKAHCAFGFWRRELREALGPARSKADEAMGGFGRITRLEDLPSDKTLLGLIRRAAKVNASGASARPARTRKPARALPVPADLATALRKNKTAAVTFERLSPSHRNEYVEWVAEAKRDETRHKRLATAIKWLAEGKRRNWRYEKC